jgi:hypothetical protein
MARFEDEEKLMTADDGLGQGTEEQDPADREERKYLGLKIFACTLPLVFLLWSFGAFDIGLNAGICLGMNILAVGMCWDLRRL